MQSNITKYLTLYSEPEVNACASWPAEVVFDYVVVVPAYQESIDFVTKYIENYGENALVKQKALLICVINQPIHDADKTPQQKLHDDISALGEVYWQSGALTLIHLHHVAIGESGFVLVINRFDEPILSDYGVGLARKIGADVATYLITNSIVKFPWIFSTDADATLPLDYFSCVKQLHKKHNLKNKPELMAACYNFTHESDHDKIHQANAQYELALRYFVKGLQYANSPYAFFTIGSLWVFHVEAYTAVRGFPKRSAGEDFYLINKVAKLGKVYFIENSTIRLEARDSHRVPFGTGPSVTKIISLAADKSPYLYYNPEVFVALKVCLKAFDDLYELRDHYQAWEESLPQYIQEALIDIQFSIFVQKQIKSSERQFKKQLVVWFDAFKTLKFIHALKKQGLSDIPLVDALEKTQSWF